MNKKLIVMASVLLFLAFPKFAIALAQEEEMKFGFFTDRAVVASRIILFNEALNKRVSEIGNRVAKASSKPDMNYTFRVINDATINAYSAAGGFIYVNTGLLDILESEDELAAILAHEIHHTDASHQINFIYAAHRRKVAGAVAGSVLGIALGVAGGMAMGPAPSVYSPSYSMHQQLTQQMADLGTRAGMAMGDAMAISMVKGYGKQQELEADRFAIQYTHKAGYDPNALVSVFKKLASIRDRLGINEKNYLSSLINAEPGLEKRIEDAQGLISKLE